MIADNNLICFKAYDVRGKLGEELNEDIAYRIGRATAQSQKAKTVLWALTPGRRHRVWLTLLVKVFVTLAPTF